MSTESADFIFGVDGVFYPQQFLRIFELYKKITIWIRQMTRFSGQMSRFSHIALPHLESCLVHKSWMLRASHIERHLSHVQNAMFSNLFSVALSQKTSDLPGFIAFRIFLDDGSGRNCGVNKLLNIAIASE